MGNAGFFPRAELIPVRLAAYRPAAIVEAPEKAGPASKATSPPLASPSQTHG